MEDILDIYATPDTDEVPLVCLDEKPVTLHADLYPGQPPVPGSGPQSHVERRDYAYARHGAANLFVLVVPQQGWRYVAVIDRRAAPDCAERLCNLADAAFRVWPTSADYHHTQLLVVCSRRVAEFSQTAPCPNAQFLLARRYGTMRPWQKKNKNKNSENRRGNCPAPSARRVWRLSAMA